MNIKKKKQQPITARIAEEERRYLESIARTTGKTLSDVLRELWLTPAPNGSGKDPIIWSSGPDGLLTFVSEEWVKLTGKEISEVNWKEPFIRTMSFRPARVTPPP